MPSSRVRRNAVGILSFANCANNATEAGVNGIVREPVLPVTLRDLVRASNAERRALVSSPARHPVCITASTSRRIPPFELARSLRRWVTSRHPETDRAGATVGLDGARLAELARVSHTATQNTQSAKSRGVKASLVSVRERDAMDANRDVPKSWGWVSAAEVVEPGADIVYGIVQPGPKLNVGVRYVRGMDVEDGKILIDQLMKTSPAIAKRYERASLKGGDVLLGIIRATKVAIVPDELSGANITQGTARFRPGRYVRARYLASVLEAPLTQKWLHDCYRGIDMPGLNLADVRRVPIALPSLEEQDEIVRRVDELLALAEKLQRRYQAASSRVDQLTPSVLAKAFRGELVPQDPNDEPAERLLERIRAAPGSSADGRLPLPKGLRSRGLPRGRPR